MRPTDIKEKVLQYKWEHWIDRPFGAFTMSVFKDGQARNYMKKAGVDAECPAILFQNGAWYKSEEIWDIFERELQKFLNIGGNVFDVVRRCEEYLPYGKKTINKIIDSNKERLFNLAAFSRYLKLLIYSIFHIIF